MTHDNDVQLLRKSTNNKAWQSPPPISSIAQSAKPSSRKPSSRFTYIQQATRKVWHLLGHQIRVAYDALLRSFGTAQTTKVAACVCKQRVLMRFSRIGGCWFCAFFDEGALHKRLPRRLTFRDVAKVYETARRGHAHLADPATVDEFELALASGRGKIWLHLSHIQREALDLILKCLFGGPGRDRTDDLFHAMENQQLTAQTAKELSAGIAVKTGTVGANWHQIDTKILQPNWAR